MRFDPQAPLMGDHPPGVYAWVCTDGEEKISKAGNDYLWLTLAVRIPNVEKPVKIKAILMFTENMLWKTKAFLECTGNITQWEAGDLSVDDCIGYEGWAAFKLGDEKNGRRYLEIEKYLTAEEAHAELSNKVADEGDDIPF